MMPATFLPDLTPAEYHRPTGAPRLSQSIATTLVSRSPYHAWLRISGESSDDATDEMDLGTLVHALLLGVGRDRLVVVKPCVDDPEDDDDGEDLAVKKPKKKPSKAKPLPLDINGLPEFPDWKTKAAQQQRIVARAAGKVALLPKDMRRGDALARRVRDNLAEHGVALDGYSELAVHWSERAADGAEVLCRGMLDHWHEETATIYDLKIVADANPRSIARKAIDWGYDIQAEAYRRAVEAVLPRLAGRVRFVLLFCEVGSALVTPVAFAGTMREHGASRWRRAVNLWARCTARDEWPGYASGGRPVVVDAPEWAMTAEMTAAHEGNDLARFVGAAPDAAPDGYDDSDEGDDDDDEA